MPPLKSVSKGNRAGLLVFALLWTGFSLTWMALAWTTGAGFFALFGLPFVLVGFGMMGWCVKPFVERTRLGPPEATVSSERLRPGETFTFVYRQPIKQALDIRRVSVQLIQREAATYTQGTDTTTVRYDLPYQEFEQPPRHWREGETLLEQHTLKIPADAMHTFTAKNNKIQWLVQVRIEIPRFSTVQEEYELMVLPERIR
jgi:hypothetical protein